jgi:hypothetical protein
MAALAAEFPGWHIWRSRSRRGAETGRHAAVALSPADIGEALEALELVWAEEYVFGYDLDKRVFWAARPGEIGLLYVAPTQGELNNQLVSREAAAR